MAHLISSLEAWEALDSRGNPTIAVAVGVSGLAQGVALAPAGASAGSHEATFLRDGAPPYSGQSVREVIGRALPLVRSVWIGKDAEDPAALDAALRLIDPSPSWAALGGNFTTAATVAAWLALAHSQARAPWEVISEWTGRAPTLPVPMVNMVSGGAHAAGAVAIQDVLAIPHSSWRVEDAIETAWRVRKGTREVMTELGFPTALIADEGGLAAGFSSSEDAIKAVVEGVSRVGLVPGDDVGLALDVAANEFLGEGDRYQFEGETLSDAQLVAIISRWASTWPISSIEDPLAEDADWTTLAPLLMKTQIVGDDRYATSVDRLATGISRQEANSVLIKPNQAGTLWGALEAIRTGKEAGWGTIVSARSGDTEEQWLVDLAVGSGAGQIKVGSTMRSERTAKWNRMLELSARENLPYAGNEK